MACAHEEFEAAVDVHRLKNSGGVVDKYMADVSVRCSQCKRQFQFLGLPAGVHLGGASVSIDALEARLAICPQGEEPSALDIISAHFRPKVVQ